MRFMTSRKINHDKYVRAADIPESDTEMGKILERENKLIWIELDCITSGKQTFQPGKLSKRT